MKIVYFNTLYDPVVIGGAETSLKNLIHALIDCHNIDPIVVTLSSGNVDIVEYINSVKVYRLAYRNHHFIFGGKSGVFGKVAWHIKDSYNVEFDGVIKEILRNEAPDIVHTNNLLGFSGRIIELAYELNLPIVHTIRDYYFQCWRSCKFSKGKICHRSCISCMVLSSRRRKISNLVNAVVGNSQFILDDHVLNGIFSDSEMKSVIYNIFEPEGIVRSKQLQKERGRVRLGFIGRLSKVKGIKELVDLVEGSEFELYVAGQGELEGYVRRAQSKNNNIHYLGFVKPSEFFNKIDFLVVPSLWDEPLARTIYEAYSYGVPVIGSNTGGTPEIIREGVTGVVFNITDFKSVLRHVRWLSISNEKYQKLSSECIAFSKCFSAKVIADQYYDVYKRIFNDTV